MNNNRNNAQIMNAEKPVFIVEKETDANTIIEAGSKAVALDDKANTKLLFGLLNAPRPAVPPIIVAMNPEDRRSKPSSEGSLVKDLDKLDVTYCRADIFGSYSNLPDAYASDPEKLKSVLNKAEEAAREFKAKADAEKIAEIKSAATVNYIDAFWEEVENSKNIPFISTGFRELDKILGGGLQSGLYIIGAISSLGKSTFCLQVADQIAKQERDVCVFSLEMARKELMAKSISRLTFINDRKRHDGSSYDAKTTHGISKGQYYDSYSNSELNLIKDSSYDYSKFADHLYIIEGVGDVGVKEVRKIVEQHTKITGQAPVVIIDYLQILAPADPRSSDKQNTDKAVLELKRISRDFDTPVIAVSSFNRENYNAPVNMTAFKESGAIEYSSDVLIGLQYDEMEPHNGSVAKNVNEIMEDINNKARAGLPIGVQAKILKYRNGSRGTVYLDFYPKFNYFEEHLDLPEFDKPVKKPTMWKSI